MVPALKLTFLAARKKTAFWFLALKCNAPEPLRPEVEAWVTLGAAARPGAAFEMSLYEAAE